MLFYYKIKKISYGFGLTQKWSQLTYWPIIITLEIYGIQYNYVHMKCKRFIKRCGVGVKQILLARYNNNTQWKVIVIIVIVCVFV